MKNTLNPLIVMIMFFINYSILNAQNLVLNPSFEDTVFCPTDYNMFPGNGVDQVSGAQFWSSALINPDYYNCTFDTGYNSVVQNAFDGTAKMALSTFIPTLPDIREVLIGQLSEPLTINEEYYVSMKVKPSTKQCYATNNLGILFTNQPYSSGSQPFSISNFAHVNSATIVSDTTNWTTIEGSFIADSNYHYLLIGNFFDDASTETITPWNEQCVGIDNDFSYYFIDDICVSKNEVNCDVTVSVPPQNTEDENLIYPNPASDQLTIVNHQSPISKINIIEPTGKIYKTITNNFDAVNISNLPSGVFFLEITTSTGTTTTKFIKQ